MIRLIDSYLNRITMYRLVLYELIFLLLASAVLSAFGVLSFTPLMLGYSVLFILFVSLVINAVFAYFLDAPSNPESAYITALILALIIAPPHAFTDTAFIGLAAWAAGWAMASKYIFAIGKKHVFNPAAIGVAMTALFLYQGASWWVGTPWMLPFVVVGGFLVARKVRRLGMVATFLAAFVLTALALGGGMSDVLHTASQALLFAPAVFFATVMLTEPLTAPTDSYFRILFAIMVGFCFAPQVHIGSFYFTPELALLAGNIFAYLVSPKQKLLLTFVGRVLLATSTYEFIFSHDRRFRFIPGQYLEWTLAHPHPDTRGIRRYFTIASTPTDTELRIGVKFYEPMSSFKKALLALAPGETIVASQLAGNFVLPKDPKEKLMFMAGGIGITPFVSMIEYLLAKKERRDIVIVYANRGVEDAAYVDLLDRAERELGIQVLPVFSQQTPQMVAKAEFPQAVDSALITREVADYRDRRTYISGPHGMIIAFEDLLKELGVPRRNIKTDFFPGFA